MANSSIEWTDAVWNPTRGCSRVSPGCTHCYAERVAVRFADGSFQGFAQITNGHPAWTGKVELIESKLGDPLHWKKPRRIFVNSMSDLFHESLSFESILRVYRVMQQAHWHTYQILTKRADRLMEFTQWLAGADHISAAHWPRQCWIGVSVENQKYADERIPLLLQTQAAVRFVSYEPALGPVDFRDWLCGCGVPGGEFEGMCNGQHGLDWIIVGGESGPGARPFDIAWARNTIEQCKAAGVAGFVKQLGAFVISSETQDWVGHRGGIVPTGNGCEERWRIELKDRKGGSMDEWPPHLRVREFPTSQSGG